MNEISGHFPSYSSCQIHGFVNNNNADVQVHQRQHSVSAQTMILTRHKRISLVKQGKMLRGCLEVVLQGPGRIIDSSFETLGMFSEGLQNGMVSDLVIISIGPQDLDTIFSEITAIRLNFPATRWIVLSQSPEIDLLRCSVASGIEGLLYEDSPVDVLRLVTDLVLLGHSLLPAELATLLQTGAAAGHPVSARPTPDLPVSLLQSGSADLVHLHDPPRPTVLLSQREDEILGCLTKGHSNKTIARELLIAEATVKAHVKALLRKMQVTNRTQAAIAAPLYLRGPERRDPERRATTVMPSSAPPHNSFVANPANEPGTRPMQSQKFAAL